MTRRFPTVRSLVLRGLIAAAVAVSLAVASVAPVSAQWSPGSAVKTEEFAVTGITGTGSYPAGALGNRFGGLLLVGADVEAAQFAGWVYLTIGSGPDADRVRASCIEPDAPLPSTPNVPVSASGWDELSDAPSSAMRDIAWLASHPTYQNTTPHTLDSRRVGTLLPPTLGQALDDLRADDDRIGVSGNLRAYEAASLQAAIWSLAGFEKGNESRYSYPGSLDAAVGEPLRRRIAALRRIAEASAGLSERPHGFVVRWEEGSEEGAYRLFLGGVTSSGVSPLSDVSVEFSIGDGAPVTATTGDDGTVQVPAAEAGTRVTASMAPTVAAGTVMTPSGNYQQVVTLDPLDYEIASYFDMPEEGGGPVSIDPSDSVPTTEPPATTAAPPVVIEPGQPETLPNTGPSGAALYWILGLFAALAGGAWFYMTTQRGSDRAGRLRDSHTA